MSDEQLTQHRLEIEAFEPDLYIAFFVSPDNDAGVFAASLCRSLAALDTNGTVLENWRSFLEALLRDCTHELTGYPREAIELRRIGHITTAALKESN